MMSDTPKFANDFEFVKAQIRNPPSWSNESLLAWSDVYSRAVEPFISKSYWTDTGSINVFRIVGTDHPDYIGKTWLEFLQTGKRMSDNLSLLEKNPDYYLTLCKRDPRMVFTTLDGLNYYVSSDGNHRSCLARFFLGEKGMSQLHNLSLSHYQIDWQFFNVYQELDEAIRKNALSVYVRPENTRIAREDTAGWKLDIHCIKLLVEDQTGAHELGLHQAREYLEGLKQSLMLSSDAEKQSNDSLLRRVRKVCWW